MYRFPIMQHRLHSVTRFFPFLKKIFNDRTDDALFLEWHLNFFFDNRLLFYRSYPFFLKEDGKVELL